MRRGILHRVLNGVKRALVSLTIRCVKKIRSLKLAEIVDKITAKLVIPTIRIHKHITQGTISNAKKIIEEYSRMLRIFLYHFRRQK